MPYEPREGSGVLFPERDKKNEKAPDFKGNILIGGNQIRIAGWKKQGQKGTFISLSVDQKPKAPAKANEPEADFDF